jgi:hypothetical protein
MTAEEVVEMMECEGEEYEMPPTQQEAVNGFEELFDDAEMEPTQNGLSGSRVRAMTRSVSCKIDDLHPGLQTII